MAYYIYTYTCAVYFFLLPRIIRGYSRTRVLRDNNFTRRSPRKSSRQTGTTPPPALANFSYGQKPTRLPTNKRSHGRYQLSNVHVNARVATRSNRHVRIPFSFTCESSFFRRYFTSYLHAHLPSTWRSARLELDVFRKFDRHSSNRSSKRLPKKISKTLGK